MGRDYRTTDERRQAERILVVTADDEFSAEIEKAFDRPGRLIDAVRQPDEELMQMVGGNRYDCVIVDHTPPTVDAPIVIDRIRSVAANLPVLTCGCVESHQLSRSVMDCGASDYWMRPTDKASWDRFVSRFNEFVKDTHDHPLTVDDAVLHRTIAEDVLGTGDIGLVLTDDEGRVRWANNATGTFFGFDPSAIVGNTRRHVVRKTLEPVVTSGSKLVDRLLNPVADESGFLIRTDARESVRWLDTRSRRLDDGQFAGGRVDRFAEVTSFVHNEYGLRELQQLMVDRENSFSERLHQVLLLGVEYLDLPYGFVTAIDQDTQTVLDAVGDHELLKPGETAPLLESYCRRTLASRDLVSIPDAVTAGWENDPAFDRFSLKCYVGSPVVVNDDPYGTFCFASTQPREDGFSDDEELFVEFAAAWTGWELEHIGRGN